MQRILQLLLEKGGIPGSGCRRRDPGDRIAVAMPSECGADGHSASKGRWVKVLAFKSESALKAHDWPGSVRELRNVIERAVHSCKQKNIRIVDLPNGLKMKSQLSQIQKTNQPLDLEA